MSKVLVAIQHSLTPAQKVELTSRFGEDSFFLLKEDVDVYIFNKLANMPADITSEEVRSLAKYLLNIADTLEFTHIILPIGHPSVLLEIGRFLGRFLGTGLFDLKILFAMSERKSVEKTNPDGSVTKTTVFEHVKFEEF